MKEIIVKVPLSDTEEKLYDFITNDEYLTKIFFSNAVKKVQREIYRHYHLYRDAIVGLSERNDLVKEGVNL